ncbi:nucleotidyl transferase AbiEii/AbiGii toxin family protein [Verrucomicrobium sp. BvORR106]|uniref:nucleotidyl transferase AbiEii/AbiGii toxin family protein n=1 Tax=Verrucomicrobium sp. BvORR106 TaxID=1403819 RepID=UPI0005712B5D|nr:nucleotidyl transferase AbiEii/AbiGii toxin family protein [Verrucomicrobium sp. BvORR106]
MLQLVIQSLASAQDEGKLRFHLIGGYGLDAHHYHRDTRDLDILIASDEAEVVHEIVSLLGYVQHDKTPAFLRYWHPTDAKFLPIDVMLVNSSTFAKLSSDSITHSFQGVEVTCPSVASFIALKLHALKNNPGRTRKDLNDIAALVEKNPGSVTLQEVKALCDRYAPPHIFDKLKVLLEL